MVEAKGSSGYPRKKRKAQPEEYPKHLRAPMTVEMREETIQRVQRYAQANGLKQDAIVEAAVTLCVPSHPAQTLTLDLIALHQRAEQLGVTG